MTNCSKATVSEVAYTEADLALFEDLQRAAQSVPVSFGLMCAGAILSEIGRG